MLEALKKIGPIVLAVFAVVSAVTYLVYRIGSERAYREKWKDYIDCGMA